MKGITIIKNILVFSRLNKRKIQAIRGERERERGEKKSINAPTSSVCSAGDVATSAWWNGVGATSRQTKVRGSR